LVSGCWRRWPGWVCAEQKNNDNTPRQALAFGAANAMIVDELALLLDLKDVYWAKDGRESVDVAVGVIAHRRNRGGRHAVLAARPPGAAVRPLSGWPRA
jgi:hypothetical protein